MLKHYDAILRPEEQGIGRPHVYDGYTSAVLVVGTNDKTFNDVPLSLPVPSFNDLRLRPDTGDGVASLQRACLSAVEHRSWWWTNLERFTTPKARVMR